MCKRCLAVAAVLAIPFLVNSCATMSKEECVAADWRVVGESDGATGYEPQSRFAAHTKSCEKAGIIPDQALWYQGFQQGLTRYCTPLNGLSVGQQGKSYNNVCPVNTADGFLRGYRIGKAESDQRRKVDSFNSRLYGLQAQRSDLIKRQGAGKISPADAQNQLASIDRETDRVRFEKQRAELDLSAMQRDSQIFAANPNMVIPPRYSY